MNNVLIRELEFPITVEGVTVKDTNGDYNVYINALLPPEKKQAAIDHELAHIKLDHLYKETAVKQDEDEAKGNPTTTFFTPPTVEQNDICSMLKALREKSGLTKTQAAAICHVRPSLYIAMERGFRKFNKEYEDEILFAMNDYANRVMR